MKGSQTKPTQGRREVKDRKEIEEEEQGNARPS
jgi:hypothetical protein